MPGMTTKKKKTTKKKSTARRAKSTKKEKSHHFGGGRRGVWKGYLSFGLVNIPVILETAQQDEKIHFRMIDKRDNSPVGYQQINKKTGKVIDRSQITKGYEYKKGKYVLFSDADFKKANVKATSTVDIEDFVKLSEVDPMLFEKPYYVIPQKGGEKGYALLRKVLQRTGKAAVAKIVLHTVQRLVAIYPRQDHLILEILRFANEVKEIHEVESLPTAAINARISERELLGAEQLVESMSSKWAPDHYRNTYREDVMKLVKSKVRSGKTAAVEEIEAPSVEEEGISAPNVIDLTNLLQRSLKSGKRSHPKEHRTS